MEPVSSDTGRMILALLVVTTTFALATALVRRGTRMPVVLASAAGLAVQICAETSILNALNAFYAVTRASVLAANAVLIGVAAITVVMLPARGPRTRLRLRLPRGGRIPALLVVPLVALAAASAVRYAPNTGDSMTYHLARVAHWIQRGSIDVYPTGTVRQTVMMPGAEYLLLVLQIVSGSDRLAPLLQFGAYLILVFAAPTLARYAGTPSRLASWAAPAVASLPMAVLQASSTQNDLVAAVIAVAIVGSALRLRRMERRPVRAAAGLALVGLCCAAALLVKASGLVVSMTIVAALAVRLVRRGGSAKATLWLAALVPATVLATAIVLPELVRRNTADRISAVVSVYPLCSEWGDRAANAVRGVLHHLPAPPQTPRLLQPAMTRRDALVPGLPQLVPHEDVVGDPIQAAAVVFAAVVFAFRLPKIARRGRWAVACAVLAWLLFHATLRDNEYVTRLQLPLFALAPAFLAVVPRPRRRGPGIAAIAAGTCVAVGLAVAIAIANSIRPPFATRMRPGLLLDYYANNTLVRDAQFTTLRIARTIGCRRIGLFMGESGWDYPLTWQAMQGGIEVRHVFGSAEWPCLVYAEPSSFGLWNIPREPVALGADDWAPAASNQGGVFLYRRKSSGAGR